LISYVCGFLFGCGILFAGVCNPDKIISFLAINTQLWSYGVLVFMATAIGSTMVGFFCSTIMMKRPVYTRHFEKPVGHKVDVRLLIGSALFGIGLGLTGLTPATGFVNFFILPNVIWFVLAMAGGMYIHDYNKGDIKGHMDDMNYKLVE